MQLPLDNFHTIGEKDHMARNEVPFLPFPESPRFINLDGYQVLEYLSPKQTTPLLLALSDLISRDSFATVMVNLQGGTCLLNFLIGQGLSPNYVHEIEYHRPPNGFGVIKTKPVPQELRRTKNLIIEDVYDTGGVVQGLLEDAPNSIVAVATHKIVDGQINIPPQVLPAMKVNGTLWLGGLGMNLGGIYPNDYPRNYLGLVVKPA